MDDGEAGVCVVECVMGEVRGCGQMGWGAWVGWWW